MKNMIGEFINQCLTPTRLIQPTQKAARLISGVLNNNRNAAKDMKEYGLNI